MKVETGNMRRESRMTSPGQLWTDDVSLTYSMNIKLKLVRIESVVISPRHQFIKIPEEGLEHSW